MTNRGKGWVFMALACPVCWALIFVAGDILLHHPAMAKMLVLAVSVATAGLALRKEEES